MSEGLEWKLGKQKGVHVDRETEKKRVDRWIPDAF